jgi:hypothetical protein
MFRIGWNTGGAKSLFYNGQYLADAEDVIVVTIKCVSVLLTMIIPTNRFQLSSQYLWIPWSPRNPTKCWFVGSAYGA